MKRAAAIAVAVSGGRDSMALLHCTVAQATAIGLRVVALHVHHGLMPSADVWAAFVERTCKRWARQGRMVSFAMHKLEGQPAKGDSVEAWARARRYAALAQMAVAEGAPVVLLAHHLEDQAETVLLQALRGAGPAGLAAMPAATRREGITWLRPWLATPGDAIAVYARSHRLRWVEDASNADPRFARSRLRQDVMPTLRRAFAQAPQALAAVAVRCARAQAVLDEVANADLAAVAVDGVVHVAAWKALSDARQELALHAWLNDVSAGRASESGVESLVRLLREGRSGDSVDVQGGRARLYRARLSFDPLGLSTSGVGNVDAPSTAITEAGRYAVAGGVLVVRTVSRGGVPLSLLQGARWLGRSGGLQFQRAPKTPPRSLKKAYQLAGVPAWQRHAPLLFASDGQLIFAPHLGMDARAVASIGHPRVSLRWEDASQDTLQAHRQSAA